jgi:carboxymethylenebutenolidase
MMSFTTGFLPFIALLAAFRADAPQPKTALCHDPNAVEPMAKFVSDAAFVAAHEAPAAMNYQGAGQAVQFKAADGSTVNAVEFRSAKKSDKWVFVIHEWWGLNDWVKAESENIYSALGDVNVLALDMYDGKMAVTPDSAGKLMQSMKQDRGAAIVKAAVTYVGKNAKIATIGWCFGGGWSLQATLIAAGQASACVMYYGMPVDDVERLKTLKTDVLFVLATQDKWITPAMASTFEANMKKAGKSVTVKSYDADHAFANPSNPKHNASLAKQAFSESISFIKARFK